MWVEKKKSDSSTPSVENTAENTVEISTSNLTMEDSIKIVSKVQTLISQSLEGREAVSVVIPPDKNQFSILSDREEGYDAAQELLVEVDGNATSPIAMNHSLSDAESTPVNVFKDRDLQVDEIDKKIEQKIKNKSKKKGNKKSKGKGQDNSPSASKQNPLDKGKGPALKSK